MDKQIDLNRMLCSRSHFRTAKGASNLVMPSPVTQALDPAVQRIGQPKNIVDGDFVESFLDQARGKQLEIIGRFTYKTSSSRADDQVTDNIISLVQAI